MTDAETKPTRARTRRSRAATGDKADAVPDAAEGPEESTTAPSRSARRGRKGQQKSGERGAKEAGAPSHTLGRGIREAVQPVLDEFSHSMIRAVEPLLNDMQSQIAHVIKRRLEEVLPQVGSAFRKEAQREIRHALLALHREEEGLVGDAAVRRESREEAGKQPIAPVSTTPTDDSAAERVETEPDHHDQAQGGSSMTAEAEQTDRTDNEQTPQNESANPAEAESTNTAQAEGAPGESSAERERAGTENSGNGRPPARRRARRSQQPTYVFSPQGAAQAGLLHLATVWKESGALYQAIPAYLEILERYPRTGVAAAATEGLVDLAHRLEEQGRFYTALSIFRKMETML